MIKKMYVSIILIIAMLLIGCSQKETPFLEYQSKNFEAQAKLEINGEKYSADIVKSSNDCFTLTFTAPEAVSGVGIEKKNNELFFSSGNVHIPLKENTNITAETLKLFNLSKDDLVSTNADMLNGVKVNIADFKCDYGSVKLFISSDTSLPVRIEADIKGTDVIVSFSDFSVTADQENT